jgi:Flp pilus assembly protein TadD
MKLSSPGFFRLLGFTSILASAVSALAVEPPWVEIQSPHFSVATDAGEKRGREVAMRFEQMRAVFSALLVKANVNIPIPLQIVAFRNTKELRQVSPLWNGKPIELAGLFQGGEDRSFIMLDMSVDNPWTVVFHEYAHQLMNGTLTAQVDPWFEEGFAEYFSTIEVDGKEARVGKIPSDTYQELRQEGLIKTSDLFKVRHDSSTYNESGSHRTVFYAESSLVMHYLYDNGLVPKLSRYFELKIDKNSPVEDAIQQAFGMSAAQFDKSLRDYFFSGRYKYYAMPSPPNIVSQDYRMKPLSLTDSKSVLADIHLHSQDYHGKAIDEYQDILQADPNNSAACRGLGYAYLQKQDFEQAGEYFKKASQADSKDPRVHYYSALLMSRQASVSGKSNLPEMTKELQAAIALDPNFADPYMLLAFAQMNAGDNEAGLASIQKAVTLSPRNETYRLNLAQMYLGTRKVDQAIAVLKALQKSSNPMIVQRAGDALEQAERLRADTQETSNYIAAHVPATTEDPSPTRETVVTRPNQGPPKFLKGVIQGIDCSSPPVATLTIASGKKSWKMQVPDSSHVLLIGADSFSCSWTQKKVAINYRETGEATGSVFSIEIQ